MRGPNRGELAQTAVLELRIEEASAKVREGPPIDDEADLPRATWAGVLPLSTVAARPAPDPQLREGIALPPYLEHIGEAPP